MYRFRINCFMSSSNPCSDSKRLGKGSRVFYSRHLQDFSVDNPPTKWQIQQEVSRQGGKKCLISPSFWIKLLINENPGEIKMQEISQLGYICTASGQCRFMVRRCGQKHFQNLFFRYLCVLPTYTRLSVLSVWVSLANHQKHLRENRKQGKEFDFVFSTFFFSRVLFLMPSMPYLTYLIWKDVSDMSAVHDLDCAQTLPRGVNSFLPPQNKTKQNNPPKRTNKQTKQQQKNK